MPRKPPPDTGPATAFPVYRDGLGRPIPNEDEILRQAAYRELRRRFSRRVTCTSQGRGGTVVYQDSEHRVEFWHEVGGGPCKWWIDVPPPEAWEALTGLPLAERDELLQFVAEAVQRDQCPSWHYRIGRDAITYHAGPTPADRAGPTG